jgi:hypothetical protein
MRFAELRKLVEQLVAGAGGGGGGGGTTVVHSTDVPDQTVTLADDSFSFPQDLATSVPHLATPCIRWVFLTRIFPMGPIEFECTFVRGANAEAGNSLQLSDTWSGEMWDKTDLLPSTVASTTSRLHAIGVTDPNPGGGLHR